MSQSPDKNSENQSTITHNGSVEKLYQFRELMINRLNEHTSGKTPLPPEQSLSLRSNISKITQMIEPGTKEMWPDYTSAEKAYMAEQNINQQRAMNDLGIAALGPVAASPAILAKMLSAPPETVDNFLELGFNMTAAAGLSKIGRSTNAEGVVKPATELESIRGEKAAHQKPQMIHKEAAPLAPEVAASNLIKNVTRDAQEAQPILDWYRAGKESPVGKYDTGRLAVIIEQYGGETAKIIAEVESSKSIDEMIRYYKTPGNSMEAIEKGHQFTMDFVDAISSNGNIEPVKLKEVLQEIKEGNFVTTSDFAALEYARSAAHTNYIRHSVSDALGMARISGMTNEQNLKGIEANTTLIAEQNSPYQISKTLDRDLPPPDKGQER